MFSMQTSLYHATMKQVVKFPQLFFFCTQCSKMEFFYRYKFPTTYSLHSPTLPPRDYWLFSYEGVKKIIPMINFRLLYFIRFFRARCTVLPSVTHTRILLVKSAPFINLGYYMGKTRTGHPNGSGHLVYGTMV